MALLLAAAVVGAGLATAVVWAGLRIARALDRLAEETRQTRTASVLALFAPGMTAAQADPRALLTWEPLAADARRLFPDIFAQLDGAHAGRFPFGTDQLQAAHARWTAEWLAWEAAHDLEFKLKAAAAEADLPSGGGLARARLDAIEREKLGQYQRRYEEYVRVAKALQSLGH